MRDRGRAALSRHDRRLFSELVRYGVVSVLALAVDFGTLIFCTEVLGLHYLESATIAFTLGIIANYICSRLWVFADTRHARWIELVLFLAVGVTGLLLNNLIMWVVTDLLHVYYVISKMVSTVVVFFWNFLLRRFLIYTGDPARGTTEDLERAS